MIFISFSSKQPRLSQHGVSTVSAFLIRPLRVFSAVPMKLSSAAGFAATLFALCGVTRADVRLPALFSDHMVLQAKGPAPVWGWAEPGEEVTVSLGVETERTVAGADGKWKVTLAPAPGSDPRTLTVKGHNTLELHDVLAGEVWLCSGQSNMGISVASATGGAKEAEEANLRHLRFFDVAQAGTLEPRDELAGKWQVCTPALAAGTSAVAFFFARGLVRDLDVPVGIIRSAVGGTPIENWISREALATVPGGAESAEAKLAQMKAQPEDAKHFPVLRDAWEQKYGQVPPPNEGAKRGWADSAFDDHDWKTIALPANGNDSMGVKQGGVFWLRKEVEFPAAVAGKPFMLVLNYMHEQYDTTYFNGEEVGHTGDKPPLFYMGERRYLVPGELVKEGRNVIAVRVVCANPRWDLMGRGARGDYNLPIDQKQVGNQWRCRVESLLPPLTAEAIKERPKVNAAAIYATPVVLYNAMIHPLMPYGIRGVVWYQGESNIGHPENYAQLLPTMMADWRQRWGEGDFPFYLVQLANYGNKPADPNQPSGWAQVREAQAETARKDARAGIVVILDADDGENMHPKNKIPVGERLSRLALARTYGRKIEDVGPTYESMSVEGSQVRVKFSHATGLMSRDGAPKYFAVAGSDGKYAWAEARIDGESVLISSPAVSAPVAVRYCWADNPVGANLYNGDGLPAAPFRTDGP